MYKYCRITVNLPSINGYNFIITNISPISLIKPKPYNKLIMYISSVYSHF